MKPLGASPRSDPSANQPPPLLPRNLFTTDPALTAAVRREAEWAMSRLKAFGSLMGSVELYRTGFRANEHPPRLHTHDRFGERIDEVEFHPAYDDVLRTSIEHRVHNLSWQERRKGSHVARAGLIMLAAQNEFGHTCPIGMTHAAIPVIERQPELAETWCPLALSDAYDPSSRPAADKMGALIGMAMTERQGGSDLRANTTRAVPIDGAGPGRAYRITGHKWFCSAPMCDAFLALAQAEGGLSCFLLPRWTDEGVSNGFQIRRLKDKIGNRSNASAEVEFADARAWLVGEEGAGVRTIIEMVNLTRLDCALTSAGLMRRAVIEAIHHGLHRRAFGRVLSEHPLMEGVLADIGLESEASTRLTMRLAAAYDVQDEDERERLFLRVALPASKYWICKRAPWVAFEALECVGGGGYVEESILARIYRDSALNSVWEGCSNIICLDVLRALDRESGAEEATVSVLEEYGREDERLGNLVGELKARIRKKARSEAMARDLAERLALALQASLMVREAPGSVADAFLATRVTRTPGIPFGTFPAGLQVARVLDRVGA